MNAFSKNPNSLTSQNLAGLKNEINDIKNKKQPVSVPDKENLLKLKVFLTNLDDNSPLKKKFAIPLTTEILTAITEILSDPPPAVPLNVPLNVSVLAGSQSVPVPVSVPVAVPLNVAVPVHVAVAGTQSGNVRNIAANFNGQPSQFVSQSNQSVGTVDICSPLNQILTDNINTPSITQVEFDKLIDDIKKSTPVTDKDEAIQCVKDYLLKQNPQINIIPTPPPLPQTKLSQQQLTPPLNQQQLALSSVQQPSGNNAPALTVSGNNAPAQPATITPTAAPAPKTPSDLAASLKNKIVNVGHTLLALAYRILFLSNKYFIKNATINSTTAGGAGTQVGGTEEEAAAAAAEEAAAAEAAKKAAAGTGPEAQVVAPSEASTPSEAIVKALNTAIEPCKKDIKDENLTAITSNIPAVIDSLTNNTPLKAETHAPMIGSLIYNFLQILISIKVDCIANILNGIKTVTPLPKEIEAIVSIKPDCFIKAIALVNVAPLDEIIKSEKNITAIVSELMTNPETPDIKIILGIAGINGLDLIKALPLTGKILGFLKTDDCGKAFVTAFETMKGTGTGPGPGTDASKSLQDTSTIETVQGTQQGTIGALPESTAQPGLSTDINKQVVEVLENLATESTTPAATESTAPVAPEPVDGGANHKKRKTTRRRHSSKKHSSKKHKRSRHKRSRHKRK